MFPNKGTTYNYIFKYISSKDDIYSQRNGRDDGARDEKGLGILAHSAKKCDDEAEKSWNAK